MRDKELKEKAKEYLSNSEPDFESINYAWVYENVCRLVEFHQQMSKETANERYEKAFKYLESLNYLPNESNLKEEAHLIKALKIAAGLNMKDNNPYYNNTYNISNERFLEILPEIYPELSMAVQATYNLVQRNPDIDNLCNSMDKFITKLRQVENITEEEIEYVKKNMDSLYFQYTDYKENWHGDYSGIERRLFMRIPSIKQAWRENLKKIN